ncbi:MAG: penicillin-insensitive murein endopeptidase [Polyangiaceae bacterium]
MASAAKAPVAATPPAAVASAPKAPVAATPPAAVASAPKAPVAPTAALRRPPSCSRPSPPSPKPTSKRTPRLPSSPLPSPPPTPPLLRPPPPPPSPRQPSRDNPSRPLHAFLDCHPGPRPAPLRHPRASPPFSERYFPFLEDETEQGSISVGDTSYGYIVNARRVTEGEVVSILPRQRGRDLRYGTDQLIALLEDAARTFRSRTGTRFWIGNIGRRGGGDIPYSVSHNSGRDADIALAYTDLAGAPADPPDLIQVDSAGFSREKDKKLRFDPARTWQIIRALLESDKAQIEFLFLARNLIEKVLRHAAEKREPAALLDRAVTVLHQPGGAPHDDHLHIRVACSERDVEGGCVTLGPARPWVPTHAGARARRVEKSVAALSSPSADQRARAVERLVLLQARDQKDPIAKKLDDPDSRVRAAVAHALARWGTAEDSAPLAAKVPVERDPLARAAMLSALSDLGGSAAGTLFATELSRAGTVPWEWVAEAAYQPTSPTPFLMMAEALSPLSVLAPQLGITWTDPDEPQLALKLHIIDAAGLSDRPEPVEPLFALLRDADPAIRAHAAQALSRLLNRPLDLPLTDPAASLETVLSAASDLESRAAPLRRNDRSTWVVEGFSRAGFKVPKFAPEHAWEILRAFAAGEPYSHNAARALARIAHGVAESSGKKKPTKPPIFEESTAECRYWKGWLEGHRTKLSLPPEPDSAASACR